MRRLYLLSIVLLIASIGFAAYLKVTEYGLEDLTAPVISMDTEEIAISVEDSDDEILRGVTATDDRDGDVTDSLIVDSLSNFTEDGRRFVTIAAFDSSNNVAKATKTIRYTDYHAPRLAITEPMVFRTGVNEFLEAVSAKDVLDGDITNMVKFSDNTTVYTNDEGLYSVQLQVRNSAGDTAFVPFTLEINNDLSSARVVLKQYIKYTKVDKPIKYEDYIDYVAINGKEWKIVEGNTYEDQEIGRKRIKINSKNVDYSKPGTYEVEYKVDSTTYNSNGDVMNKVEEDDMATIRLIVVVEG